MEHTNIFVQIFFWGTLGSVCSIFIYLIVLSPFIRVCKLLNNKHFSFLKGIYGGSISASILLILLWLLHQTIWMFYQPSSGSYYDAYLFSSFFILGHFFDAMAKAGNMNTQINELSFPEKIILNKLLQLVK